MEKNILRLFCWVTLVALAGSCSKEKAVKPTAGNPSMTLGLYEYGVDSGKRIFIPITKIGTQSVNYFSVFDSGSSGMTIDAHGIIPAAMISSSGIQFTGDSVVVNGITIIAGQSTLSYGNKTSLTKEYGYLAYAPVTIGDQNGNFSAKRIPIFLYYKVVDGSGKEMTVDHSLDVFGVGPGTSYSNSLIPSPLNYFNINAGVISGFKLAMLQKSQFISTPVYVAGLLTIGLTSDDISSSGFIMHPLKNSGGVGGYSANIPSIITYNGQSVSGDVLFDTGTPLVSTIENKLAINSTGMLLPSTVVTVTTNMGFTYSYTTTTATNLTQVENPNVTGDLRTIFGIDFFIQNEYLTDYEHHQIGLKNN